MKEICTPSELDEMEKNKDPSYESALNDYANNLPFHTLIKGHAIRSYKEKWYPIKIERYQAIWNIDFPDKINKNVAYNLQYLEFLAKQINELEMSEVLTRILYKNFVITGVAIIEAIFAQIIINNKDTLNLEETGIKSKDITQENPLELNKLIRILQKNSELLNKDKDDIIFEKLDDIRELRNNIHLAPKIRPNRDEKEHDYRTFTIARLNSVSQILLEILKHENINHTTDFFGFLIPLTTKTEDPQQSDDL